MTDTITLPRATVERVRRALELVRAIIVDGGMTGFNCHDGDWAQRLFESQSDTYDALALLTASLAEAENKC